MSRETKQQNENAQFWTSKANLFWVILALLLMALHVAIHHNFPQFNPPATPNKPSWMRIALYGELAIHILFLGAVITAIGNRVPSLKRPNYSDEGVFSLNSPEQPVAGARWGEIGYILIESVLYLAIWGWIYGII